MQAYTVACLLASLEATTVYCQTFHGCVKQEGGSRGETKGALHTKLHTISFFHIGYSSCLASLAHKQYLPWIHVLQHVIETLQISMDIWMLVIVHYVYFHWFCLIAGKNGCSSDQCVELVEHIILHCAHLKFSGLMTIGEMNYDWSQGANPDFIVSSKLIFRLMNCWAIIGILVIELLCIVLWHYFPHKEWRLALWTISKFRPWIIVLLWKVAKFLFLAKTLHSDF